MTKPCTLLVIVFGVVSSAAAQEPFRLTAPQAGVTSEAMLSARELAISDMRGQTTVYIRDPQFDSADGAWVGYYSRAAGQVIRWPADSRGNLQIGEMLGNTVRYKPSQMVIEPLARVANRVQLPASPQRPAGDRLGLPTGTEPSPMFDSILRRRKAEPQLLQLVNVDARGAHWYLTRGRNQSVSLSRDAASGSPWWIVPAGRGSVRIQLYDRGRVLALSAARGLAPVLAPLGQDPGQLWYVAPAGGGSSRYVLESAMYRGKCLGAVHGQVLLQPIAFAPPQFWVPLPTAVLPGFEPFWRTVTQQVVPNPPLPAARLDLANTHRYPLFVLLADQRQLGRTQQIRIEPGQTTTLTLERDPGATLVETYEIRSPSGIWERQQFATVIPPQPLYDMSVYEQFLQSIAVDRTGKSPNPIEDVNYSPKSVGWFLIPPGDQLPPASTMDVLAQARAANNPGAVRRMDMKQFDDRSQPDPVESLLERLEGAAP